MKYRLLSLLAAFGLSTYAQNWSTFLDSSRAKNWTRVGFMHTMKRSRILPFSLLLLLQSIPVLAHAQATYTAASCNYADVNSCVNGSGGTCSPSDHTVVNGDIVQIPAGTCTWTQQLVGPSGVNFELVGTGSPNIGSSTTGANSSCANGTTGTLIIDDYTGNYGMIEMRPSYNATYNVPAARVSCMAIDPYSTSTALWDPILVAGTCSSANCPAIRVDNITFGLNTPWSENGNSSDAEAGMLIENVFGVIDHNSIGSSSLPATGPAGFELFNSELGAYLGSGSYGDNSWVQADSLGNANNLFAENNLDYNAGYLAMTDSEQADAFTNRGGARTVMRYNVVYQGSSNNGGYGLFQDHGTDSGGRARGAREAEVYKNTLHCQGTTVNCYGVDGSLRSGTGLLFGNTFTSTLGAGPWIDLNAIRNDVSSWNPFSPNCGGFSPWDVNDSASLSSTYTISSTGTGVINDTSAGWTAGQFAPVAGSGAYLFYDMTAIAKGEPVVAAILGNTSTQLSLGAFTGGTPSAGDSFVIVGTHLYYAGTITSVSGGGGTGNTGITDIAAILGSSDSLLPSGAPYSVFDASAGWGGEISANTATSITVQGYLGYGPYGFSVGDTYWVTRATVCLDQPGRGQQTSTVLSGNLPSPMGAVTESIDPVYQWNDTATEGTPSGDFNPESQRMIAYRDFYPQASGVQTSSSSPFSCNGSTGGTGWGTLANRPSSCSGACSANTLGCGYFATDQGSQGTLYVWESGAWTTYYQPYAYPHPLDGGTSGSGGDSGDSPSSPTNVNATATPTD